MFYESINIYVYIYIRLRDLISHPKDFGAISFRPEWIGFPLDQSYSFGGFLLDFWKSFINMAVNRKASPANSLAGAAKPTGAVPRCRDVRKSAISISIRQWNKDLKKDSLADVPPVSPHSFHLLPVFQYSRTAEIVSAASLMSWGQEDHHHRAFLGGGNDEFLRGHCLVGSQGNHVLKCFLWCVRMRNHTLGDL